MNKFKKINRIEIKKIRTKALFFLLFFINIHLFFLLLFISLIFYPHPPPRLIRCLTAVKQEIIDKYMRNEDKTSVNHSFFCNLYQINYAHHDNLYQIKGVGRGILYKN